MGQNNVVQFPRGSGAQQSGARLIPSRLLDARLAARLNQTELAGLVGVTRQSVSSYELGDKTPEPDTMKAIAEALGQPVSFFTQADAPAFGRFSANFFRKTGADTKRRNAACEVYARWLSQITYLFDTEANFPEVDIPHYEPVSRSGSRYLEEEIEDIAERVRQRFGLGLGPISNVIRLLERRGIIVCRYEILGENIEAFSYWSGSRPFIFLASDKDSAVRARFDAAHELGHLVLHKWVTKEDIEDKDRLKEIEGEADRFAGAFLLPRKSFPNEIYSPRIGAFVDLKARWKVSIQAMIYRCRDLGIFDERQVTNLYKQISFKKWRKREPLDGPDGLPLEQPLLLRRIAELVLESGRFDKEHIRNAAALAPEIVESMIGVPKGFLASEPETDFIPTLK